MSRTDRIGDVVLSLPVFASLKRSFPESELTALVGEYASTVVSSFPAVDSVLTLAHGSSTISIIRKLRRARPDAMLILFPRFRIGLAAFLAGIPVRVGTAYRWYSFLFNRRVREHRKDSTKSEAEYNLAMARAIGCDETVLETRLEVRTAALGKTRELLQRNGVDRFVVLHPGSGGSAHEWGHEKFHEAARAIGEDLGLKVLITGTSSEKRLCSLAADGIPGVVNTAGRFTLEEFIALLSLAEAFVSNSTGPLHLAASVGTPVVGIYPNSAPMTPVRWAPLTDRKIVLTPRDGSDNLSSIDAHEVVKSVARLISVKAQ